MKSVLFAETIDEVDSALDKNIIRDDLQIIALSYTVQVYLKKLGINFFNSLPYFDNQSHIDSLLKSEELLHLIEDNLKLEIALLAELSFYIRPLIHYSIFLSEIISRAVKVHNPKVIYGPIGRIIIYENQVKIGVRDRMLGFILKSYSGNNGIEYKELTSQSKNLVKSRKSSNVNNWIKTQVTSYLDKVEHYRIKEYQKRGFKVLIAAEDYNLSNKLLEDSKKSLDNISLISLDLETGESPLKLIWRSFRKFYKIYKKEGVFQVTIFNMKYGNIKEDKEIKIIAESIDNLICDIDGRWKDEFCYKGIFFSKCITKKISIGIKNHILLLARLRNQVQSVLKYLNPNLVVSPYDFGLASIIGSECKAFHIPTVLIPHGSVMLPHNNIDEIEIRRLSMYNLTGINYEYSAAQSPWAERHCIHFGKREKILKTNPVLFAIKKSVKGDKLRNRLGIQKNTKVVLYAVTEKQRSNLRFHAFEIPDEVIKSMHEIIKSVNKINDVHLILKLHPSSELDLEIINTLLPNNNRISILKKIPFDEVLSLSDVLISYSSSAVEEAILNRLPVILFDNWNRYCYLDAFNCDNLPNKKWNVDAVYYTSKSDQLSEVIKFASDNADNMKSKSKLYKRHLYHTNEAQDILSHMKNIG